MQPRRWIVLGAMFVSVSAGCRGPRKPASESTTRREYLPTLVFHDEGISLKFPTYPYTDSRKLTVDYAISWPNTADESWPDELWISGARPIRFQGNPWGTGEPFMLDNGLARVSPVAAKVEFHYPHPDNYRSVLAIAEVFWEKAQSHNLQEDRYISRKRTARLARSELDDFLKEAIREQESNEKSRSFDVHYRHITPITVHADGEKSQIRPMPYQYKCMVEEIWRRGAEHTSPSP